MKQPSKSFIKKFKAKCLSPEEILEKFNLGEFSSILQFLNLCDPVLSAWVCCMVISEMDIMSRYEFMRMLAHPETHLNG